MSANVAEKGNVVRSEERQRPRTREEEVVASTRNQPSKDQYNSAQPQGQVVTTVRKNPFAQPQTQAPPQIRLNQQNEGPPSTSQNDKKKQIGNYQIGETLGQGTFGKVKAATHVFTGEKVAIKILEKEKIADQSDVERVTREIQILKQLRHQNIIQLYEIIETSKLLFLITEYASGGELFDFIVKNNKVPEREASRFFQQIISGVEYIHRLRIVHRDLKPENLLLTSSKKIKIVDFGLSNLYKKNEMLKTACGSPCYAAPEMIAGKRYQGLGVDIWSCGVILFALICGYLPFEDPSTTNLYKKILGGEYTIPKHVSEEARDLITNILTTEPLKRFTIQDIRKHPWMNQVRGWPRSQGIIVGMTQIPIDEGILQQLSKLNMNLDYARVSIENNRHNHATTTYYLLLKKHIRNGAISIADISSDAFSMHQKQLQRRALSIDAPGSGIPSNNNGGTIDNSQNMSFQFTQQPSFVPATAAAPFRIKPFGYPNTTQNSSNIPPLSRVIEAKTESETERLRALKKEKPSIPLTTAAAAAAGGNDDKSPSDNVFVEQKSIPLQQKSCINSSNNNGTTRPQTNHIPFQSNIQDVPQLPSIILPTTGEKKTDPKNFSKRISLRPGTTAAAATPINSSVTAPAAPQLSNTNNSNVSSNNHYDSTNLQQTSAKNNRNNYFYQEQQQQQTSNRSSNSQPPHQPTINQYSQRDNKPHSANQSESSKIESYSSNLHQAAPGVHFIAASGPTNLPTSTSNSNQTTTGTNTATATNYSAAPSSVKHQIQSTPPSNNSPRSSRYQSRLRQNLNGNDSTHQAAHESLQQSQIVDNSQLIVSGKTTRPTHPKQEQPLSLPSTSMQTRINNLNSLQEGPSAASSFSQAHSPTAGNSMQARARIHMRHISNVGGGRRPIGSVYEQYRSKSNEPFGVNVNEAFESKHSSNGSVMETTLNNSIYSTFTMNNQILTGGIGGIGAGGVAAAAAAMAVATDHIPQQRFKGRTNFNVLHGLNQSLTANFQTQFQNSSKHANDQKNIQNTNMISSPAAAAAIAAATSAYAKQSVFNQTIGYNNQQNYFAQQHGSAVKSKLQSMIGDQHQQHMAAASVTGQTSNRAGTAFNLEYNQSPLKGTQIPQKGHHQPPTQSQKNEGNNSQSNNQSLNASLIKQNQENGDVPPTTLFNHASGRKRAAAAASVAPVQPN